MEKRLVFPPPVRVATCLPMREPGGLQMHTYKHLHGKKDMSHFPTFWLKCYNFVLPSSNRTWVAPVERSSCYLAEKRPLEDATWSVSHADALSVYFQRKLHIISCNTRRSLKKRSENKAWGKEGAGIIFLNFWAKAEWTSFLNLISKNRLPLRQKRQRECEAKLYWYTFLCFEPGFFSIIKYFRRENHSCLRIIC